MDYNYHKPVLLNETINMLSVRPGGIYMDATLGGGGHFMEILERAQGQGKFIGIDQDEDAISNAVKTFSKYGGQIDFVHDNFKNIKHITERLNLKGIDGIIFDLGVSSFQLDEGSRGFSYMKDAPLDMRMDRRSCLTAEQVVNEMDREALKGIFKEYGEEAWAGRIADFICERRKNGRIATTGQLTEIIKDAIPARARRKGPHPAKRVFQALRIYVNKELEILESSLKDAVEVLNAGGRVCVITFHSLEDRIVKNTFKELATGCICPKDFPVCTCGHKKIVKVLTHKPILPAPEEIEENPRSRSAKLRAAEKLRF